MVLLLLLVLVLLVALAPRDVTSKSGTEGARSADLCRVPAKQGALLSHPPFRPDGFGGEGVLNGAA